MPSKPPPPADLSACGTGCVVAFIVLLVALFGGVAVVAHVVSTSASGGVTRPDFDPSDPEVRAARREAWDRGKLGLSLADQRSVLLHPAGLPTQHNTCVRGQANWQTVDEEAVVCTATVTRSFAFGGPEAPASIRQVLADLEGDDCSPTGSSQAAIGASIYLEAPGRPYRNFPDGLQVDDIAGGDAACGPAVPGTEVHLRVRRWRTLPTDAATAGRPAPADRWAVVLETSERYWSVDWE